MPKFNSNDSCATDCGCDTPKKPLHKTFPFWSFWVGLVVSIVFFTYFEVQNYNSEIQKTEIMSEEIIPASENGAAPCCADDSKCE